MLSSQSTVTTAELTLRKKILKRELEGSQTKFTKFFFKARNETFIPGDHHQKIEDALFKLEQGALYDKDGNKCTNLLINIAPRFGKTQFVSIDWPARCIARNRRAKFIHLSYSDDLALDNSGKCRELIGSKEYQNLWAVQIKSDSDSKKKWYTIEGGGMYATAAGGPITGFGAGSLADVSDGIENKEFDEFEDFFIDEPEDIDDGLFYGAIIIDDPIKVDDAYSELERNKVNARLNSTIKNRRNSRKTPIVIVMQRLHEQDLSGFVLDGGMGERFYHLNLPTLDARDESIWPIKHTTEELHAMRAADFQGFMAQYMQNPTPEEGTFFKKEWFEQGRYRLGDQPSRLVTFGAGDYAVTEDGGDYTEQGIGGFDHKNDLWLLDWSREQVTLDKSIDRMIKMVLDNKPLLWAAEMGTIRRAMEPFLLKEQRQRRVFFKMEWLPATKSKAVNARAFQALASQGKVHIPRCPWGDALIDQLLKFTGRDDKHDDGVDVCGLFGRLLDQTYGPQQYSELFVNKNVSDDYGTDDDSGDWRVT